MFPRPIGQNRAMTYQLRGVGVWSGSLRYGDAAASGDAAAELESLGYSALWLPDIGGNLFESLENVLRVTKDITIATGILNLWMQDAELTAAEYTRLVAAYGRRLLLGIGVSHAPLIDRTEAGRYAQPLARTEAYLDALDAIDPTVPVADRLLAALGPKMLALSGAKASGTHPYNVMPEHTAAARAALGPGKLVAPEQAVVLETDPDKARAIARRFLSTYLALPNYANNWFRFGFTPDDTLDGGTDALIDALIVWGDVDTIVARVQAHFDAGADHVCVQALSDDPSGYSLATLRELAPALRSL
jgi:probable F420-dependent oxidoreductase